MGETESQDKPANSLVQTRDTAAIADMFNHIASRYDLMNRLMTGGQDARWRKLAVTAAEIERGDRALDVATGTGDMARELAHRVGPSGSVIGIDVAGDMLQIARLKTAGLPVTCRQGDVHDLGFDSEFDAVTVAFGLRNFRDREAAVAGMARALRERGRLVILELIPAHGKLKPLIDVYERRIIPLLGRLLAPDRNAYSYLPQSVAESISTAEIEELMRRAGLTRVISREMNFGTVALVTGIK